jgi:chromosome segregation ATPase
MTQAQYYRSVAAQNQSKAGDQWAFFQAKRVRGTIQQMFAERGAFRLESALTVANRLPKSLERTEPDAKALLEAVTAAIKTAGGDSGTAKADLEELKKAVEKYQGEVQTAVKEAKKSQAAIAKVLAQKHATAGAADGLTFLTTTKLPVPLGEPLERPSDVVESVIDKDVLAVLVDQRALAVAKTIRDDNPDEDMSAKLKKLEKETKKLDDTLLRLRPKDDLKVNVPTADSFPAVVQKMEADLVQKFKKLDEKKIQHSIDLAEEKANQFDKGADPATGAIRGLEALLVSQDAAFRSAQSAAEEIQMAVADLPATDAKLSDVHKAADALQSAISRLAAEVATVSSRFKAARCDYDVRRYDREARFNQEVAALYELQVRKSSLTSDVHRERSMYFLYAMLAAQAGVTIATFALAVRQKSVLWALATAAGVTAITISIFAFQFI